MVGDANLWPVFAKDVWLFHGVPCWVSVDKSRDSFIRFYGESNPSSVWFLVRRVDVGATYYHDHFDWICNFAMTTHFWNWRLIHSAWLSFFAIDVQTFGFRWLGIWDERERGAGRKQALSTSHTWWEGEKVLLISFQSFRLYLYYSL